MMHAEFHLRYPMRLAMIDEHLVIGVVSDSVLFGDVAQSENVVNCSPSLPHLLLGTFDLCLPAHDHGAVIALQAHALVGFEDVGHQRFVTDQIDSGLAVQQDNLS
jgi:hypothetical protein